MKTCDLIEQGEDALEVVVPVDNTDEMQRHFGIFVPLQDE